MKDERAVWTIAAWLVEKHGEAAKSVAQREAVRVTGQLDAERRLDWTRVAQATVELLRLKPRDNEQIH
jgi:hypothetical protein